MEGSDSWLITIQGEIMNEERLPSGSIHKLPESVINVKAEGYKPRIISFGPYHYGEPHLEAMEKHKKRAVDRFFRRSKRTIGACWGELGNVVGDLKLAYTSLDPIWQENTQAFLQLMIRDGCFILEFLRLRRLWLCEGMQSNDYAANDPIFSRHGMIYNETSIFCDIFLLQNQLPLLVLRWLLAIYNGYEDVEDQRIDGLMETHADHRFLSECTISDCHLLDVFRKNLVGNAQDAAMPGPCYLDSSKRIWSAREMQEAGIRIESSSTRDLTDISFHRGILRLPTIVVDGLTETLFLNLMASERFQTGIGYEVTSYVFFMASIIHDAEDVKFLSSVDVIVKYPTSITNEYVAELFKLLSRDIRQDPDNGLLWTLVKLQRYCEPWYKRCRAYINRKYFRSTWARISLFASLVLFGLTFGQTLYTIIAYYKK